MRILIADDHNLVREMIGEVLEREAGCEVEHAASLDEVLEKISKGEQYDLVLLDYQMPGTNDLAGLKSVLRLSGDMPVAMLSGVANRAIAEKALEAGARGFLPKSMKARSLVNAVNFMAAGEVFVPVDFMTAVPEPPVKAVELGLTRRELEVLGCLCDGFSNKEIGLHLDVHEATVKLHVKTLSRKLKAKNRTHAAMLGRDLALLSAK